MIALAELLERLAFADRPAARKAWLCRYLKTQSDPDRGYGLAVLAGALRLPSIAPGTLRSIAADRIDSALLAWSHDFVGDFAESVALAWPAARSNAPVPTLREMIGLSRDDAVGLLPGWLDAADPRVRYALLKAMAPSARPAISGSEARSALAAFGGVSEHDIETIWHGVAPPYESLFAWLERRGPRPRGGGFFPFMLAVAGRPEGEWIAEPLLRGDRLLAANGRVFSRSAEEATDRYPDLRVHGAAIDGVMMDGTFVATDILFEGPTDLRPLPWHARRQRLMDWIAREKPDGMRLVETVAAGPGMMLKRRDSPYVAGREHRHWLKYRPEEQEIVAVLMYAEAGTFTVGVGDGDTPVPVGTVDGGLFAELLEQWVKSHTIGKFGRVREVEKSLMLRVSFGRVRKAPRRKAGILLDGARIAGWPDGNAILTTLDALRALA